MAMSERVAQRLVALNRAFYEQVSAPFARSRATPQPGFRQLLPHLPAGPAVLDVGCGEGRFGRFLLSHRPDLQYTGLDFTASLLELAAAQVPGNYQQRDLSQPEALAGLAEFDLVSCLAVLQHIPGAAHRHALLGEMVAHLKPGGRLILSSWQFLDSARQGRKIRPWTEAGLAANDVEPGDYLLSWQRGTTALRYVAFLDEGSLRMEADRLGCTILTAFRADGREGDLNLYMVWQK